MKLNTYSGKVKYCDVTRVPHLVVHQHHPAPRGRAVFERYRVNAVAQPHLPRRYQVPAPHL